MEDFKELWQNHRNAVLGIGGLVLILSTVFIYGYSIYK